MNRLHVEPEARKDLADALGWYDEHAPGWGDRLLDDVEKTLAEVRAQPRRFARVADVIEIEVRRALLRRFPYAIVFLIAGRDISIIAVAHHRRDPEFWRRRIAPDEAT